MKKALLLLACMVASANVFANGPRVKSLDPYSVVLPSLNGDPASADRVSGQMYYDVSTNKFKGINNSGAVKSFVMSGDSTVAGAKIVSDPASGITTPAILTFDSTVFDTGSFVSGNTIVIQKSGPHLVCGQAYMSSSNTSEGVFIWYNVNSTTVYDGFQQLGVAGFGNPTSTAATQGCVINVLSQGDILRLWGQADAGDIMPAQFSVVEIH